MKVLKATKVEDGFKLAVYFCPVCHSSLGSECECHGPNYDEVDKCPYCFSDLEWPKEED